MPRLLGHVTRPNRWKVDLLPDYSKRARVWLESTLKNQNPDPQRMTTPGALSHSKRRAVAFNLQSQRIKLKQCIGGTAIRNHKQGRKITYHSVARLHAVDHQPLLQFVSVRPPDRPQGLLCPSIADMEAGAILLHSCRERKLILLHHSFFRHLV